MRYVIKDYHVHVTEGLRARIADLSAEAVALRDERDALAREVAVARRVVRRSGGWCAYCGVRVEFGARACRAHSDLPRLEAA